jgi:lysophospholipase L1-like esterase
MGAWWPGARALLVLAGILACVEGAIRLTFSKEELLFPWELPVERGAGGGRAGAPLQRRTDGPYVWYSGVNASGLREDQPRKGPRYLAVGDSWIYGYGADRGATLPDALEALLPPLLGVPDVEVTNAGEPGANVGMMRRHTLRMLDTTADFTGVILGQPHNPRTLPPARPPPAGVGRDRGRRSEIAMTTAPYTYAAMRRLLAPAFWRSPPRNNAVDIPLETRDLAALIEEIRSRGKHVWLVLFPHERDVALSGRFGPEHEWTALDVPSAGSALRDRACWGWEDRFHPSPAGYRAIAEVVAPMIAAGAEATARAVWSTAGCPTSEAWPGPEAVAER